jgi:hypothetical protein
MKNIQLKPIKDFTAIVTVEWCTTFEANDKKDFIKKIKEQYKEDYNIELVDDEISMLDEEVK